MKKKNGFTLIELLAVVVILGVIMTVAAVSVSGVKKNANTEAAKKLEQTLKDIGTELYTYEMMQKKTFYSKYTDLDSNGVDTGGKICDTSKRVIISVADLKAKGYLKSDLKVGNVSCKGFVEICKDDGAPFFSAKICCPGIYHNGSTTDCADYNEGTTPGITLN